MQRIARRCVVVILRRKTLQVTQQCQPAPVSHLLHSAKIQDSGETVEPQPSHVSRKECHCHERQPGDAPVWNNFVDQEPDDQRVEQDQNARCDDAYIASQMQTKERLDL